MKLISSALLTIGLLGSTLALAQDNDDNDYVDIPTDLATGMELLDVAERAHANIAQYYELAHGHPRDENHDHGEELPGVHEGEEEELSAYEAVGEIWLNAKAMNTDMNGNADPDSLDIVKVVIAVIDAWNQCDDTFGARHRVPGPSDRCRPYGHSSSCCVRARLHEVDLQNAASVRSVILDLIIEAVSGDDARLRELYELFREKSCYS